MPSRRSMLQENEGLIFHAPLTSDVNDVVNQIQGVNVDGTWDSYASTRGIKIVAKRYQSNVYWDISSLRTLLLSATTIIVRSEFYVINFVSALGNANNYANIALVEDPTSYTSSTLHANLLTSYGDGNAVAFVSLNSQNTMQFTWSNITDTSHNRLRENLTRGTSLSDNSTSSALRSIIKSCDYLHFFYKIYVSGGTFNGYLKDLKIWVK